MKKKNFLINMMLVFIASSLAILFLEGITRVFLNPVDYLMPDLYTDEKLVHRILPGSGGHDEWGFRNKEVPKAAEIVTIGDSQTYGGAGLARDAWPFLLGKNTRKSVYNLSLGGYGPAQYYYLLKQKALQLNPKVIIVGFYFGNDLLDTYNTIYSCEYWDEYKEPTTIPKNKRFIGEKPQLINANTENGVPGMISVRRFLSRHSILYNMVTRSLIGAMFRRLERNTGNTRWICLNNSNLNIHTCFKKGERLNVLDLRKKQVREGLQKSLILIKKMKKTCLENGIHMGVLLIPTKEMVYSNYFESNENEFGILAKTVECERSIKKKVIGFFKTNKIDFIDPLLLLKKQVGIHAPYPLDDGHPNRFGYAAIAGSVETRLKNLHWINEDTTLN